ncbi:DUF3445 domain-containing protein [Hellea sp.]|nr:DUF3445 domain-containing protein [Hellea sp.]
MILNSQLPIKAWLDPQTARLPGVQPVAVEDWLARSDTYAAQLAYRRELITTQRDKVFAHRDGAIAACQELRDILGVVPSGEHPLIEAALTVQEDLCILQKQGDEHVLTAAVMCFPSSWDVREKLGRSISSIHSPVAEFSPVAHTVERMLSAIRLEQPLGRANFLIYTDPELHQPRGEGVAKPIDPTAPRYIRVERQTFRRLPETLAVVFAIHTYVVPETVLSIEEHELLATLKPELLRD